MNKTIWPFLISRNKTQEYQAVVVPSFLLQDIQAAGFLTEAAGGDPTESDFAVYREIHGLECGDLTLIFHVMRATEQHLGLKTTKPLYDQSDRPINLTEGFVLKGQGSDIYVNSTVFAAIHRELEDVYRLFWENTDNSFSAYPSHPMELKLVDNNETRFQIKTRSPFQVPLQILSKPVKKSGKKGTVSSQPEAVFFQDNKRLMVIGGGIVAAATALAGYFLSRGR